MDDTPPTTPAPTACRECTTPIPAAAPRCPHCGAAQQRFWQRYPWLLPAVVIIPLSLLSWAILFRVAQPQQQSPQQATQAVIGEVGKLTTLPPADVSHGEPTLATVLDKSKLADQPFFKNAQNGANVLIYSEAQKAYLYRPSTNQLINVAPVHVPDTTVNPIQN